MKALVLTGTERVEMRDLPQPEPGPGEVLLRVSLAGICGSDVHGFLGHSPRRKPGLVLGHEAVATGRGAPRSRARRSSPAVYFQSAHQFWLLPRLLSPQTTAVLASDRMDRIHGAYAQFFCVPSSQVLPGRARLDCDSSWPAVANLFPASAWPFRAPHAMAISARGRWAP